MPEFLEDVAPTRAALMALKDERQLVKEGYNFLDEKRLLLAAEILRELGHYAAVVAELHRLQQDATVALAAAVGRHGLQGLQVYPARALEAAQIPVQRRSFLGVPLVQTALENPQEEPPVNPVRPSLEAQRCREAFQALLGLAAVLAGVSGNLYRLLVEYRRTQRRARALEDVILPEIEGTLAEMEVRLEEMEQEEVTRTHLKYER